MDWPQLGIVIPTYNRRETLRNTIHATQNHLYYQSRYRFFIADDGSDDGTQDMLRDEFPHVALVQSLREGLGANTNRGLQSAFQYSDYILQFQDDMQMLVTIDLHPHVELLMNEQTCGFVRLWGVGGHKYEGALEGNYWRVYWHSPDLFIPSDRPHVKHKRFHDHFGYYPEGRKTADTEQAWCHQCKDVAGKNGVRLDVFVPQNQLTESTWEHVEWGNRWRDKGL